MDAWMKNNPGQTMTIYDLPGLVVEALPKATTPVNILSCFKFTEIYPFNTDIFQDYEFAPSITTDKPFDPTNGDLIDRAPTEIICPAIDGQSVSSKFGEPIPSTSKEPETSKQPAPSTSNENNSDRTVVEIVSTNKGSQPSSTTKHVDEINTSKELLENIRPFPKAPITLKKNTVNRRKRKTAILTETPEKMALEEEAAKIRKKNANKVKRTISKKKKKEIQSSSSFSQVLRGGTNVAHDIHI